MSLSVRHSGAWKDVVQPYVKQGGVWKPVRDGFVRQGGVWKNFYMAEAVVTLTASADQVSIRHLFNETDWTEARTKRVIIPNGVMIGSTNPAIASLMSGTGRGGSLIIENFGAILGAGGSPNGGAGGVAFIAEQPGIVFFNHGLLLSGGGGGGPGGQGGPGSYVDSGSETSTFNNWAAPYYSWSSEGNLYWNTTEPLVRNLGYNATVWQSGIYTYHREAWVNGGYGISRSWSQTIYTAGGPGGAGGRGHGHNQTPLNGSPGSAGGTNAGTGGTGGAGGDWGAWGAPGATGTPGNNGAGYSGAGGGAPGAAILIPANVNLTNTGTIAGPH